VTDTSGPPEQADAGLPVADEAMAEEFGTVASWTADAVEELGREYAVPAGCRGSGSPAALRWTAEAMGLREGTRLLDSGAGVGGPAELVAQEFGVRPTLVDPMLDACRAASRLYGRPAAVASGERLPFADGAFDAAWSLGVLCTVEDQWALVRDLVRVVRTGGAVGILAFVREVQSLPDQPAGNNFPTAESLQALVDRAGLTVTHRAALTDFPDPPAPWQAAVEAVEEVIERDHGTDRRKATADEQSGLIGQLIGAEQVVGRIVVARVSRPPDHPDRPGDRAPGGG
jgi:ubiquinone/menaquinone biosynthesis C-methylase UbiE